jgi:serine/threonine protein kinase
MAESPTTVSADSPSKLQQQVDVEAKKITQNLESLFRPSPNTPAAAAPKKKPRILLTDFIILRTLGTGSFGRVHLVQRKMDNSYFALKVMKKSEIVRLKQVEHTMNEKKILDIIEHPFLVNMVGSFQDSSNLYFALDYVSGGELFSLLRRSQVCARRTDRCILRFYSDKVHHFCI